MGSGLRRATLGTFAGVGVAGTVLGATLANGLQMHSSATAATATPATPVATPSGKATTTTAPNSITASTEPSAQPTSTASAPPTAAPSGPAQPGGPYDRATIESLLAAAQIIDKRPQQPGYDRDCGSAHACSFGPAWTDDTDAPEGHNGCDTRNDVLGQTLQDVAFDPDSHGCDVVAGHFTDPYTGKQMDYATEGSQIQIDHLIPLAAAWDLGAATWSQGLRERFANDTRYELLAVNGGANMSKGDSTPASWLPPNKPYRCEYLVRYLRAAAHYHLPITRADAEVTGVAARKC